jgi:hypothetical protein
MSNAALVPLMTAVYSVKRASGSGVQTGAEVTVLTGLEGTNLFPVSADTMQRIKLDAPYRAREVYLLGLPAVQEGDYLNDGAADYLVKGIEPWAFRALSATKVVVEMQVPNP